MPTSKGNLNKYYEKEINKEQARDEFFGIVRGILGYPKEEVIPKLRELIRDHGMSAAVMDEDFCSALEYAMTNHDVAVVDFLYQQGKSKPAHGENALKCVVSVLRNSRNKEKLDLTQLAKNVQYLINNGTEYDDELFDELRKKMPGLIPLYYEIAPDNSVSSQTAIKETILESKAKNEYYRDELSAQDLQRELFRLVWPEGVNDVTPRMYSNEETFLRIRELIISHKVNVDAVDDLGYSALQYAATECDVEVTRFLCQRSDINFKGSTNDPKDRGTALKFALETLKGKMEEEGSNPEYIKQVEENIQCLIENHAKYDGDFVKTALALGLELRYPEKRSNWLGSLINSHIASYSDSVGEVVAFAETSGDMGLFYAHALHYLASQSGNTFNTKSGELRLEVNGATDVVKSDRFLRDDKDFGCTKITKITIGSGFDGELPEMVKILINYPELKELRIDPAVKCPETLTTSALEVHVGGNCSIKTLVAPRATKLYISCTELEEVSAENVKEIEAFQAWGLNSVNFPQLKKGNFAQSTCREVTCPKEAKIKTSKNIKGGPWSKRVDADLSDSIDADVVDQQELESSKKKPLPIQTRRNPAASPNPVSSKPIGVDDITVELTR